MKVADEKNTQGLIGASAPMTRAVERLPFAQQSPSFLSSSRVTKTVSHGLR
jgi:hypothetical protein